jgi:hypothetical protein
MVDLSVKVPVGPEPPRFSAENVTPVFAPITPIHNSFPLAVVAVEPLAALVPVPDPLEVASILSLSVLETSMPATAPAPVCANGIVSVVPPPLIIRPTDREQYKLLDAAPIKLRDIHSIDPVSTVMAVVATRLIPSKIVFPVVKAEVVHVIEVVDVPPLLAWKL